MINENSVLKLTRDDVLRLIAENNGITKHLNPTGQIFVNNIDLTGLNLMGIIMKSTSFPQE